MYQSGRYSTIYKIYSNIYQKIKKGKKNWLFTSSHHAYCCTNGVPNCSPKQIKILNQPTHLDLEPTWSEPPKTFKTNICIPIKNAEIINNLRISYQELIWQHPCKCSFACRCGGRGSGNSLRGEWKCSRSQRRRGTSLSGQQSILVGLWPMPRKEPLILSLLL